MDKFWQIVKYEYTRHVFRKRFLMALLSLPLMVVFLLGVTLLTGVVMTDRTPVGYVDYSGLLADPITTGKPGNVFEPGITMIAYSNEADALDAMNKNNIQAFFVLPENYPAEMNVPLQYNSEPDDNVQLQITNFVRANLFKTESGQIQNRLDQGTNFTLQSRDGSREFGADQWYNLIIPALVAILFIVVVMTSGGYLLQAVVEEKENRTMEIVVTSVSPMQLMAGKVIGNISVGLTQLVIWILFAWLAMIVAGKFFPVISNIQLSTDYLLKISLLLLPAFVSIAAMMAALGATVTGSQEAQQVSGLFTLPIMVPLWFVSSIMLNPDGPIAIFLSYFPLSAPITLALRMVFSTIPDWQWLLFIIIQVAFAVFMVWLAARAFRIGMLQYGKRIRLGQLFRREVRHG
jgi:ABC-2 type transport system permease protein